jgi:hypothetical protein
MQVIQDKTPASGEVRERTITAAFNVHGGEMPLLYSHRLGRAADNNRFSSDGSPNNFKRQLLYLLDAEEQRELAEHKYRLRLIK